MAGVGTPRRLSYGALAAGIGGVVLIISLFLDWFSSGPFSQTGWETFKFTDIVLLVLGLLAIGYALVDLVDAAVNLPFNRTRALTVVGIVATTLTLEFVIEGDHQAIGLILALLASLAILIGGIIAEQRPELAVALGGGPGAGAGAPPPGTYGAQQPPAAGYAPPVQQPPMQQPPVQQPPPAAQQPPAAGATTVGQVQPASPPPPPGGAADWYPDPHGVKRLRYWDGNQWTEHTAD